MVGDGDVGIHTQQPNGAALVLLWSGVPLLVTDPRQK